jgi:beta-galactosidase
MQINAAMCDNVYGDNYKITGDKIINIGNNVSLGFASVDFGNGISKLTICGRTPNAVNSIRLSYGAESQLLEFYQCADYTEQTFELRTITGRHDINFVFLPGSNFDFNWFRFEQ